MSDRQVTLGLFMLGFGHNMASWRDPAVEPSDLLKLDYYKRVARKAEAAKLDMVFFAEILYSYEQNGGHCGQMVYPTLDPLTLTPALAAVTEQIGLIGTYSTTYTQAAPVAERLAAIDHLSGGRIGWNIVTTGADQSAANYGGIEHPDKVTRYERAADYVRTVQEVWSKYPASPQGRPVFVQAGMSPEGTAFASRVAEAIFSLAKSREASKELRDNLHRLAGTAGRSPQSFKLLPGLAPVLGSTEKEAREQEERYFELVHPRIQMAVLNDQFGMDFSVFPLDEPMPMDAIMQSPRVLSGHRDPARLIEKIDGRLPTLREHLRRAARVRGHMSFVGTPEQLADHIQDWFEGGACDGFNIMPPLMEEGLDTFIDQVLPILRKRKLFREDYSGSTLRDHLGLAVPA